MTPIPGTEWTTKDIECAAGLAARRFITTTMSYPDRWDVAWSAVACAIFDAPEATYADLVQAGQRAVAQEDSSIRRHRGHQDNQRAFAAYWVPEDDTAIDKLVERLAVDQTMMKMAERSAEALVVQSAAINQSEAAASAGVSVSTWASRLRSARTDWYAAWFDWEDPPEIPRSMFKNRQKATQCKRGHEFTPENTRWRRATSTSSGKRSCIACDRIHEYARKRRRA